MRKAYLERRENSPEYGTYVYVDKTGSQMAVNIAVGNNQLFELTDEVSSDLMTDGKMLNSHTFLFLFILRKYIQDEISEQPLNVPIVIDFSNDASQSEEIRAINQIEGAQQPMDLRDLNAILSRDDSVNCIGAPLRESLKLFGVSFSSDDVVSPRLAFDVYTEHSFAINWKTIADVYTSPIAANESFISSKPRSDLSECLFTYVFILTSISYSEILAINDDCKRYRVQLCNSTVDWSFDTDDKEHRDDIAIIDNKCSHKLLAKLGGARSADGEHSDFTDIIKLYSLLTDINSETCIAYNDFADRLYKDVNTKSIGMTQGQLRALALFHIQNPEHPIDFEAIPLKQQHEYCKYISDLADRTEGTLSDKLTALHAKQLGKLYAIENIGYKYLMVRLDDVRLSSSSSINSDSIRILSIPLKKLASCLHFADNRPTVYVSECVNLKPLSYGEDPFDYRPDFIIDPLADCAEMHTLRCEHGNFYCDDATTPIEILPVLNALLSSELLEPFMSAELIDYVDYSSHLVCDSENNSSQNIVDITRCCSTQLLSIMDREDEPDVGSALSDTTVARSLPEKCFIVRAFIHRLLRFFEAALGSTTHIATRLLSLADLMCYEQNGEIFIGISEMFESKYEVTPVVATISLTSERRYSAANFNHSLEDCIMALPARLVSNVVPTSIFNTTEELPAAIKATVAWLNKQAGVSLEYKDYVSYGLKFDEWDEYLVLQSCSAAGSISADVQTFFGSSSAEYATLISGCKGDVHAAYFEYKHKIITRDEYIRRTKDMSVKYITSVLTIPLYSAECAREREIVCNASEIIKQIDFRFFKNVRLQYSPITIFGTWNVVGDNVTWHTTLLNNEGCNV